MLEELFLVYVILTIIVFFIIVIKLRKHKNLLALFLLLVGAFLISVPFYQLLNYDKSRYYSDGSMGGVAFILVDSLIGYFSFGIGFTVIIVALIVATQKTPKT